MVIDLMNHHLGVSLRGKHITLLLLSAAQALMIFDDTVVHDGDTLLADMRVGILFRWFTVGCPASVGDPQRAF